MIYFLPACGGDIAVATSELMKQYDVAIWAHHGMFCSGEDFDLTFGLTAKIIKKERINYGKPHRTEHHFLPWQGRD